MDSRQKVLQQVRNKIHGVDPKARIFLFGSRARNDFRENSDWDFLILTNLNLTRELKNRFSDTLFEAELETEQVLTGIVQNEKTWKDYSETLIYKNVVKDGVEL